MSAAQASTFASLPFTQLRRNRYFYLYYDGVYAVLCASVIGVSAATGYRGLIGEGALFGPMRWEYLLALPLVLYFGILCNVFVHVCTHSSFPRPFNRIIGELCGMVVLTLNGKGDLAGVKIDASLLKPEEGEILEDLIIAAHADAKAKVEELMKDKMRSLTGGLPLPPGMKLF